MVGYDKDGFIQLIRRSESVAAEGKSEKKEKKSSILLFLKQKTEIVIILLR